MHISLPKIKSRNYLIVSINETSDYFFERLVKLYRSDDISFVLVTKKNPQMSENFNFHIPVKTLVSIFSWIFLFRRDESRRIQFELKIYYIIFVIINIFYKFQAAFLYGDRHGFAEPAALKLCEKYDIYSYVISLARSGGVNEFLNKMDRLPKHEINKYLIYDDTGVRAEHCICDIDTRKTFSFYPVTYYKALERFWKTSDNPWINGGGASSAIIVDRPEEASRLKFYGCKPEKIIKSAKIIPYLAEISNPRDGQTHNDRILGIIAPVYYEHGLCTYQVTKDILAGILQFGQRDFDKVYISLHPKMDKRNYDFLEDEWCEVFKSNIGKLLLEASMICVPAGSSIYADVLEAGVPCCVFNPLKLRFDVNYKNYNEHGMSYCETQEEMSVILSQPFAITKTSQGVARSSETNVFKKIIQG
jgi:hypothetical protein